MWASSLLLMAPFCQLLIDGAAAHQLPNEIPRCKQSDPNFSECIRKATQVAIPMFRNGIPNLGVAPLDPLHVTRIEIGQGSGPISINMKFTDISVKGLCDAKINTADANLPGYHLNYTGAIDFVTLESDYEMTGRILLLPVTGKGRCKMSFEKLESSLGPKGKSTMKKGKKYYDVTSFPLNIYGIEKLTVHFENLFNGDKTLGASMNNLLNENWRDLWGELRPAFEETFAAIFQLYAKTVFDKVAFSDVFLE